MWIFYNGAREDFQPLWTIGPKYEEDHLLQVFFLSSKIEDAGDIELMDDIIIILSIFETCGLVIIRQGVL